MKQHSKGNKNIHVNYKMIGDFKDSLKLVKNGRICTDHMIYVRF